MEHLSVLDVGFLQAEDSDRHISLAVGAVAILEGPMPGYDSLIDRFAERICRVPRLSQVVRMRPLDLGAAEWVDDPSLDLAHHFRHAALPAPGDCEVLYQFAAEVMESRLDRDRPLWQCWVVEGLTEGRWAIVMKVHHCIADGIATMHMLSALCDDAEDDSYDDAIHAAKTPDRGRPASSRLSMNPIDWYRGAWRLASSAASATVEIAGGTLAIIDGLVRAGTQSALNGPIGSMRRYSAVWVPLAEVTMICDVFGATINDVALAAITDSYRAALIRRGSDPRADSLRTLVPVSVRPATAIDMADNRVSVMLPYLPVDEPDHVQQLRTVHRRMARVKSSGQREAASTLVSVMNMMPSAVTAWTVRVLTKLPQRGVVTLATNVPGPRRRLRVMERQLLHLLPISPVALRLRTGIATLSYADEVAFGITADFDTAPDVDELAGGIEQAVLQLAAAARSQSKGSST